LDEKGRFSPKVDESDKEFHPADMIVEAIGQAPDYGFLGDEVCCGERRVCEGDFPETC